MEEPDFLNEAVELNEDDLPATQIVDDRVLKGVVAYVEVRSTNDNRSEAVRRELSLLGAEVVKKFTNDVTHVIFKEGSNRTKTKARKKGIHLVTVLWVENCKLNQEHVSERMYPVVDHRLKGTPLLMTKLKKAKSMQPRDFEEEVANSAERVSRKRKKQDALERLIYKDSTPYNSPRAPVLVENTQPRSPDDGFVLTPIRLTIPDTPPSMREKMKQLKLAKEAGSYTNEVEDLESEEKHLYLRQLQRKLFRSAASSVDYMSSSQSPGTSSVFMSDTETDGTVEEEPDDTGNGSTVDLAQKYINKKGDKLNVSVDSESSVNNDILSIAQNINTTLNTHSGKKQDKQMFGFDSDENLLSSQEIKTVLNISVKLKSPVDNAKLALGKTSLEIKQVNSPSSSVENDMNLNKSSSQAMKSESENGVPDINNVESVTANRKQRRSSRRLSVQQALKELEKSSVLSILPEKDNEADVEDEKPIRQSVDTRRKSLSIDSSLPNLKKNQEDEKRQSTEWKSTNRGSGSNSAFDNLIDLDLSGIPNIENEEVHIGKESKGGKTEATRKKTMKKKLLSLTDLTDQHSVLVEPTKCSNDDRETLTDSGQASKRGRKKKQHDDNTSIENTGCDRNSTNDLADVTKDVKGQKRKSKSESGHHDERDLMKKTRGGDVGQIQSKKSKPKRKALVNDTCVEDSTDLEKEKVNSPLTTIQDVTTQLNLTKDNNLVCSIRETTLSLSMSTAYSDSNMPSFLMSQRRSIDEFNNSKRLRKTQKVRKHSTLSSIDEKENVGNTTSSDSDRSLSGGRYKGRKSGHPSLVMTSLHSHEQDVVISVVKKLGGFCIAENVNESTTHVICGDSRRTLNVLHCIARGVWLLSKEWVIASLEADKWIEEDKFECTTFFPACQVARMEHQKCTGLYRQSLFSNIGPVYISGKSQPPRHHLVQLLKQCGGQVIGVRERASLYIGSDYHPGMTCIKTNWLLDCITSHKLLPMDRYYLDRPKRESSPVY